MVLSSSIVSPSEAFSNLPRMYRLVVDKTPLPPQLPDASEDEKQFDDDPIIEGGVHMDYGTQVKLGKGVFINAFSTWIDTCPITVGARTMFGPYVSLYSGMHPLDPEVRNGIKGPESGKPIHIGEDCWIGGNVTILPGVTIGRGSTVGAASVVTKVFISISQNSCQRLGLTDCRMCRRFTSSRVTLRG